MIEYSDQDLMLLVREGDDEAFGVLARRYRRPIFHFIYRFLGDAEAAEDLSQDVFIRLWSNAATYVPSAKISTFLYHIARNLCRDYLDKRRRLPPLASLHQPVSTGEDRCRPLEEEIRDESSGPQEALLLRQRGLEIERAVQALPEDQRWVFLLTEMEGCSYEETARILDCPVGTVASRKSAAMKALRSRLEPAL